ncbi:MAG: response regulator transcription factor [Vampirovibrionales bacterium]
MMFSQAIEILLADDDQDVLTILKMDLEVMGFSVDTVTHGIDALKAASQKRYHLILLDVMMPEMDGFQACKSIRQQSMCQDVPILLLTAKGQLEDKVKGFNAGADDYLVKPFEFQELMVRVRALFRRTGILNPFLAPQPNAMAGTVQTALPQTGASGTRPEVFKQGDIEILPSSLEVRIQQGTCIKLTPTEFEVLYCLMQHAGQAVSLNTLLQEVWGYGPEEDKRMLRVHIGGLRQKIELDAKNPVYIETLTNIGYRLNVVAPTPTASSS